MTRWPRLWRWARFRLAARRMERARLAAGYPLTWGARDKIRRRALEEAGY